MQSSLEAIASQFDSKKTAPDFSIDGFLNGYGIEAGTKKSHIYTEFLVTYDRLGGYETDFLIPIPKNENINRMRVLRNAFLGAIFGWALGPPEMIPFTGMVSGGLTHYMERNLKDKETHLIPVMTYAAAGAIAGYMLGIPITSFTADPVLLNAAVITLSGFGAMAGYRKARTINDKLFYGRIDEIGERVFGPEYNARVRSRLYEIKRRTLFDETRKALSTLDN